MYGNILDQLVILDGLAGRFSFMVYCYLGYFT